MDKFIDNNDSSNNGGIYSKFQERLKKIKLFRSKKKVIISKADKDLGKDKVYDRDKFVKEIVNNIRNSSNDRNYSRRRVVFKENIDLKRNLSYVGKRKDNNLDRTIKDRDLDEIVNNIRVNKPNVRRKKVYFGFDKKKKDVKKGSFENKTEYIDSLGLEILNKIKGNFEDKLDEIEVLMSELYVISNASQDEVELKKIKELKEKIDSLIKRVNELIEQYNLYKRNYYLDNVIGIDDNIIVDDIITYRDMLGSIEDEKEFVMGIKRLDEFRELYINLVEVRDETERVLIDNEKKIDEYDARDKKYDDIKLEVVKAIDINEKCDVEIRRQNEYFKNLMEKVSKIERQEYVTTHLRGLGEMLGSTLRFMGLMLVSPFTGMIPGIAIHTMATRRMIRNAYRHIHLEEVRHVKYEAENFESEINNHINDVDYTLCLIDDTIDDVERFKNEFMSIYNSSVPGYDETLKKIDDIEKKLQRNQNKVLVAKQNLKRSKKLNEEKLARVKKMNDEAKAA